MSGPAIIFSFSTILEHVSYPSKKTPNQAKIYQDLIKMVSVTLERLWMVSDRMISSYSQNDTSSLPVSLQQCINRS